MHCVVLSAGVACSPPTGALTPARGPKKKESQGENGVWREVKGGCEEKVAWHLGAEDQNPLLPSDVWAPGPPRDNETSYTPNIVHHTVPCR